MKTGREFLNEHIEETNIPAEHWEIEIGEMMDLYADYYHQSKLKLLGIPDVVRQSENLMQSCSSCGATKHPVLGVHCKASNCPHEY